MHDTWYTSHIRAKYSSSLIFVLNLAWVGIRKGPPFLSKLLEPLIGKEDTLYLHKSSSVSVNRHTLPHKNTLNFIYTYTVTTDYSECETFIFVYTENLKDQVHRWCSTFHRQAQRNEALWTKPRAWSEGPRLTYLDLISDCVLLLPSKQPKVERGGTESREMQTETVVLLQDLSYLSCIT